MSLILWSSRQNPLRFLFFHSLNTPNSLWSSRPVNIDYFPTNYKMLFVISLLSLQSYIFCKKNHCNKIYWSSSLKFILSLFILFVEINNVKRSFQALHWKYKYYWHTYIYKSLYTNIHTLIHCFYIHIWINMKLLFSRITWSIYSSCNKY